MSSPGIAREEEQTTTAATAVPDTALVVGWSEHEKGVERLVGSFRAIPADRRVRLAKKTSNLFRARSSDRGPGLDTSGLTRVVSVDPEARTADVQGMCTYEDLVDATLPYGLMPYVVPQLKTITLGGAVTGLGIEATSFAHGLPHESVLEMDVFTGTGEIVTARPGGTERERTLYRGFPNSYGSLGYAVRLRIELLPVSEFVEVRHVRFDDIRELSAAMESVVTNKAFDGERADFLDGVVFSTTESYLSIGRFTDTPPAGREPSRYDGIGDKQAIYYRSLQHDSGTETDVLRVRDYIWRWDTDWFWCSRAFATQNPKVRRFWPQQLLRSSFYWKIIGLDHKYDLGNKIGALKGEGPRERVVQDVEVTIDRLPAFIDWFLEEVPIEPLWLCPLRLLDTEGAVASGVAPGERPWPLYPLEAGTTYVNIGFWSSAPISEGDEEGAWNRLIEDKVSELGGHKSLYSDAFYDAETFAALYGGEHAARLKTEFDPAGRFPTLFEKAVQAR
ncbi:FAD-binding oxidoreductase [Dietzia sp.]|uniref:FAD-binding oxidoreductase n=1 Tax=Dietzia sp. TaxID=1871616 RepID=UPI002FDA80A2